MKKIRPAKISVLYLFYHQLLDVLILILIDCLILFLKPGESFLIAQIYMIPTMIYFMCARYKKQVIEVNIDESAKNITFKMNTLMFKMNNICCNFDELTVYRKQKWLFPSYLDVIEISVNSKKIAIIPYKQSIWKKNELDILIMNIKKYVKYIDQTIKH